MSFSSPILGPDGVGLLDSSNDLTSQARDSFTEQVVLLLLGGNLKGKGPKVSSVLGVPFLPFPGPKLFDPDRALINPKDPLGDLLWFDPSPTAAATLPFLRDKEKDYQKIIVDNLYRPLVRALNLNGNVVAPPLLDPTAFFPDLDPSIDIPQFLADFSLAPPVFAAKYGLDVNIVASFFGQLPTLGAAPPIPPSIPLPPVPDFDFIIFPDLFKAVLTLPLQILKPDFVVKLVTIPAPDFGSIFLQIIQVILDILLKALEAIGLLIILPKLLVATVTVLLQNLVSILVCDVIGLVLGTGLIVRQAAKFLLLV